MDNRMQIALLHFQLSRYPIVSPENAYNLESYNQFGDLPTYNQRKRLSERITTLRE
jgi:hypothetical protein